MPELPLLRFIPFRRRDIVSMCLAQQRLDPNQRQRFEQACAHIEKQFQLDFHRVREELKNSYAPFDPDADTRLIETVPAAADSGELAEKLEAVLNRANYEKVTAQKLDAAMHSTSLFQVRLYVELEDFEEVLLYTRGRSQREETLKEFFGLWRKKVQFTNYDRVVLFLRVKDEVNSDSTLGDCPPGSTMIRLFQNVPAADMEMLFPNIRVGMRTLDKLMIGVPALVSGGIVFTTKLGATLVLLGSLLGFWLGLSSEAVELDRRTLLILFTGLGTLGAYLWKQFTNFKTRKLRYTQALTENLYFKLLDNNAGVLYRVLDEAEESECKESYLAYYFLLSAEGPISAEGLDQTIENWLADTWQCRIDFEIADALAKLDALGMAREAQGMWELCDTGQ